MAAAFAFAACDNIEDDERWNEEVEVEIKKNVLIEDFTGQKCVNCPNASNLIHELQSGSIGQPNGMVDRKGGLQEYTQWKTSVAQRLKLEPAVDISISTDYDGNLTDATWGTSTVNVTLDETIDGALRNAHLNVWLTESNITAMQLQPDGSNKTDYVHNHVLRHVLTPAYGEVVSADAEGHATWTATYDVPKVYGKGSKTNLIMMHVVAFVTNDETGEVLQVVEAPLAPMIN